ncbi:MAG: hypothetical protein ACE5PO_03065 [Candidatus Bathyarchaeia archaeon]
MVSFEPPAVAQALEALRAMEGIEDVRVMGEAARVKILELETIHAAGIASTVAEWRNGGVEAVLKRRIVVAAAHNPQLRHPPGPTVLLTADEAILGEEVWGEERIRALKQRPDVLFLGKDFVLYADKVREKAGVKPSFVFPPNPFPELENVTGVRDVISASPSAASDNYIKRQAKWNMNDANLGTVLIGFNVTTP